MPGQISSRSSQVGDNVEVRCVRSDDKCCCGSPARASQGCTGQSQSEQRVCEIVHRSTKLETLGFQDVRIKTSNPQILRFSDFQSGSPRIVLKLRDIAERLQCRLE